MTSRAVNLTIFAIVLVEFASGVSSLLVSRPDGAWLFWIHRIGGLSLVVLIGAQTTGEVLSCGHVAPGERGFNWVKWVVEVSDAPAWFQSPLPLQ